MSAGYNEFLKVMDYFSNKGLDYFSNKELAVYYYNVYKGDFDRNYFNLLFRKNYKANRLTKEVKYKIKYGRFIKRDGNYFKECGDHKRKAIARIKVTGFRIVTRYGKYEVHKINIHTYMSTLLKRFDTHPQANNFIQNLLGIKKQERESLNPYLLKSSFSYELEMMQQRGML